MAEDKTYRFRKNETNPTLLIGILLILIVLFGSALVWIITQRGGPAVTPIIPNGTANGNIIPPEPEENVTEECDDSCYLNIAVSETNLSACNQITADIIQQQCYEQLSADILDACLLVENLSIKEDCVIAFAVAENDITICNNLEDGSQCRLAVDPCIGAENKNLCIALKNHDPEPCRSDRDCLINYSLTSSDKAGCELIQNLAASSACKSAIEGKDLCYLLEKTAEVNYCYQLYAIYSDEFLRCTYITYNTQYSLDCYSYFAAHLDNLSLCDFDGFALDTKWACYTNYSLLSGDLTGCKSIHPLATTNLFNCVFSFAKKFGDPSACNIIESASSRRSCYSGATIYSNENLNWSNCDKITDYDWRNKCFTESAKLYDDRSICEKISNGPAEETCRIAYDVFKNATQSS